MMIKNTKELLSHGSIDGRRIALDIIEYAVGEIDGYKLTKELLRLDGGILKVGSLTYDLSKIGDLYVVGAGTVSYLHA